MGLGSTFRDCDRVVGDSGDYGRIFSVRFADIVLSQISILRMLLANTMIATAMWLKVQPRTRRLAASSRSSLWRRAKLIPLVKGLDRGLGERILSRNQPAKRQNRITKSVSVHMRRALLLLASECMIHNRPFLADCYRNLRTPRQICR